MELEEYEAAIRERLSVDDNGAPTEPVVEPAETPPPSEPVPTTEPVPSEPPEPVQPPSDDVWEFDGISITRERAAELARFEQFVLDHPDFGDKLRQLAAEAELQRLNLPQVPTTTSPPPAPPEELDLTDPATKLLWDNYQSTQAQLQQLNDRFSTFEQQRQVSAAASAESLANTAVESFQSAHNLTDDEMTTIRKTAVDLNVLPSFMQARDPVTGLSQTPNALQALQKTLELAYWSLPQYREREAQRLLEVAKAESDKQRKLSSLGGTSGSSPRQSPVPSTKEEMIQAMIREVADITGMTPINNS